MESLPFNVYFTLGRTTIIILTEGENQNGMMMLKSPTGATTIALAKESYSGSDRGPPTQTELRLLE